MQNYNIRENFTCNSQCAHYTDGPWRCEVNTDEASCIEAARDDGPSPCKWSDQRGCYDYCLLDKNGIIKEKSQCGAKSESCTWWGPLQGQDPTNQNSTSSTCADDCEIFNPEIDWVPPKGEGTKWAGNLPPMTGGDNGATWARLGLPGSTADCKPKEDPNCAALPQWQDGICCPCGQTAYTNYENLGTNRKITTGVPIIISNSDGEIFGNFPGSSGGADCSWCWGLSSRGDPHNTAHAKVPVYIVEDLSDTPLETTKKEPIERGKAYYIYSNKQFFSPSQQKWMNPDKLALVMGTEWPGQIIFADLPDTCPTRRGLQAITYDCNLPNNSCEEVYDGSGKYPEKAVCLEALANKCVAPTPKHPTPTPAPKPPAPKLPCKVSNWGPPSTCTKKCGGGTQKSTRTVTQQPTNGGEKCPALEKTQDCNSQPCPPVDCTGTSSDKEGCICTTVKAGGDNLCCVDGIAWTLQFRGTDEARAGHGGRTTAMPGCMKCNPGPWKTGGPTCQGCGEGYHWSGFSACDPCGPGWFSVGGEACKPCLIGTYSDKPSNTACDNCGSACIHPCSKNKKGDFDPNCSAGCFSNNRSLVPNGGFIGDNPTMYKKYIRAKDNKKVTCDMRITQNECNEPPYCKTGENDPGIGPGLSCCVPDLAHPSQSDMDVCASFKSNSAACKKAIRVGLDGIACTWVGEPCIWKSS